MNPNSIVCNGLNWSRREILQMIDAAPDRTRVELHPHDPAWANRAIHEASRLASALGVNLISIEHVGSTAIPGILAKPTIDLLPIVRSLPDLDRRADAVQWLGYQWRGEFGIPGRRYCTFTDPVTGQRLFNVHIFEQGSSEIGRLLAFRDYLCAHPDQARGYESEKQRAAAKHPTDTLAYNDAKSAWIKECEKRALAWAEAWS
jgi:GrpB-like predicted nucleotidyltransferase (UPF0157 family)